MMAVLEPGNPHGQVGQGPYAVPMQHGDDARRQSGIDWVAHRRLRDRKRRHDVKRRGRGFVMAGPTAGRALESPRHICGMTPPL